MAGVALLCAASALAAQDRELDPGYVGATRESLEQLQVYYSNGARSQAYSENLRVEAQVMADAVTRRLEVGDFRTGDRIVLLVAEEQTLNDTFVVTAGPVVELPGLGPLSLSGVLRTELSDYLQAEIGRYINRPQVQARAFIRIQVSGEVGTPGFFMLPAETPITEAIMAVGGPTTSGNLAKLKIYRGGLQTWGGESLQIAVRQGRTLDELDIQDGDEIQVPRLPAFAPGEVARTVLVLSSAAIALSALFR